MNGTAIRCFKDESCCAIGRGVGKSPLRCHWSTPKGWTPQHHQSEWITRLIQCRVTHYFHYVPSFGTKDDENNTTYSVVKISEKIVYSIDQQLRRFDKPAAIEAAKFLVQNQP